MFYVDVKHMDFNVIYIAYKVLVNMLPVRFKLEDVYATEN